MLSLIVIKYMVKHTDGFGLRFIFNNFTFEDFYVIKVPYAHPYSFGLKFNINDGFFDRQINKIYRF